MSIWLNVPAQRLLSSSELRGMPLCRDMNITMIHPDIPWNDYLNFLVSEYQHVLSDPREIAVIDLVTQVAHQLSCGAWCEATKVGESTQIMVLKSDGTSRHLSGRYPQRVLQQAVARRFLTERGGKLRATPEGIAHVNVIRAQMGFGQLYAGGL